MKKRLYIIGLLSVFFSTLAGVLTEYVTSDAPQVVKNNIGLFWLFLALSTILIILFSFLSINEDNLPDTKPRLNTLESEDSMQILSESIENIHIGVYGRTFSEIEELTILSNSIKMTIVDSNPLLLKALVDKNLKYVIITKKTPLNIINTLKSMDEKKIIFYGMTSDSNAVGWHNSISDIYKLIKLIKS